MPRKANLLLIDDDPNTLASLARAFRLAGHEATASAEGLAERTYVQVDLAFDAEVSGGPAATGTEHASRMGFIDKQQGIVLADHFQDFIERSDVSVHAVDSFHRDQLGVGIAAAVEHAVEVPYVVVAEDFDLSAGKLGSINGL